MIAEMAAVFCMASTVHLEARGETPLGQRAVAHVIQNRSKKYNRPICSVVWHKGQFAMRIPSKKTMESKSYKDALEISRIVLSGKDKDPTGKALFFHADYVSPYWSYRLQPTVTIGNHLFYK